MLRFELIRNWETPFWLYYKGHSEDADVWARLFGVSEIEFYQHLDNGVFKDWLKEIK